MVLFLVTPSTAPPSYYTPAFVLGKVYSNTMMANFNHRILIINGRDDTQVTSFVVPPSNSHHLDS